MITNAQMVKEIAESTGLAAGVVRHVFETWEGIVLEELGSCEKVKLGQLVQLEVKVKPARKKRMGRNPRTGEAVQIAAKGASTVIKARVLKKVKDATPTIQKARKVGL